MPTPMSRLLVFQHAAAAPQGTLDRVLRARGHRLRFVNFARDPQARPSLEGYRGLIVLGGAMNLDRAEAHPHLATELACIEAALASSLPVLGICLGAQLLARALGAAVQPLPKPEIGWYRVDTTAAGRADPVLAPLGSGAPVFQWHSRGFSLPAGAVQLARSVDCEQQAFRYGERAYGLQFHLEACPALIARWLTTPGYRAELLEAGLAHGPADIEAATRRLVHAQQARAEGVFHRFLDLLGPAPRSRALTRPTTPLPVPTRMGELPNARLALA
jgi:GMP synthase (glutamine-hydrolysing)